MKTRTMLFAIALFFALALFPSTESFAAPNFARQTGYSCSTCHFQHFPALNSFGRAFKAGGYTEASGQTLLEADRLSLPPMLNASLITKIMYQKTNGDVEGGTNKGELAFPDEGALLLGGRAGSHIGFLLEAQLINPDDSVFASFKAPFVFDAADLKLSVIPFTTDGAGPAYGFELLNTGALRTQRPVEHRSDFSAQQYIGTAGGGITRNNGAATGVAFVAHHPLGYVNYTLWAPEHLGTDAGPYLHYARVAVTPTIAGWDLAAGVQIWAGQAKFGEDPPAPATNWRTDAWSVDAQMQGNVGNIPLGAYLSYARADGSSTAELQAFNENPDTRAAVSGLVEAGVLPRLSLTAGARFGKNGVGGGDTDNAFLIGANYLVTQNVELQFNQSWYSGDANDPKPDNGDQLTTLMVFAAF